VRQQSIVTDAHQPFGQYVHQESADKLYTVQLHGFGVVIPIVFVTEVDLILSHVDNTLITGINSL